MKDQHKKIKGYRDLSQAEIDAMNEVKVLAEQVGALHEKIAQMPDIDQRWLAIGKTELQQGFMALTRSIAQPTTF
ncbi:hypothetical protein MTZ49_01515 [Entomomonas sp. E2T0]|uniref:Acb2/Tad1 domain-containing protein n=1 Tax=Entomomonas sp. E2T0 TaxID=2930213 RepID=UPI00222827DE|nr:hypothetical protein [Entomomonas sp. E2T0]UYZ84286.1 hypothetical protein MTZ49_01515 [Entomomonas sp. E2T0]